MRFLFKNAAPAKRSAWLCSTPHQVKCQINSGCTSFMLHTQCAAAHRVSHAIKATSQTDFACGSAYVSYQMTAMLDCNCCTPGKPVVQLHPTVRIQQHPRAIIAAKSCICPHFQHFASLLLLIFSWQGHYAASDSSLHVQDVKGNPQQTVSMDMPITADWVEGLDAVHSRQPGRSSGW